MSNKYFTTSIILFLLATSVFGQIGGFLVDAESNADKKFKEYAYADALNYYLEAYKSDSSKHLHYQIAECHRLLNQPQKAEKWYKKIVIHEKEFDPIVYFHYAEVLKSNEKYQEARFWLWKYQNRGDFDRRVAKKINTIDNIHELHLDTAFVKIESVGFNTEYDEFSPTFYQNGLVFVSNKKDRFFSRNYHWDNSSYLDIYMHHPTDPDKKVEPFDQKINSRHHDGPIVFYENDSKAIFTRNNYSKGTIERDTEDISHLQLYFTEKVNGKWTTPTPFAHNDAKFSIGHASINEEGTILIFASDNPEGHGKSDLYKSVNFGGGWTYPENMGIIINTEGNEMFPTIAGDSLFFASDGHGGLGGLDIFYKDLADPNSSIVNIGSPFNSSRDDFGITTRGRVGYLSSNRNGNDDIYRFENNTPLMIPIAGVVRNIEDQGVIEGATVRVDGMDIQTDENGRFSVKLPPGKLYHFIARKEGYEVSEQPGVNIKMRNNDPVEIMMRPEYTRVLVSLIDLETGETIENPVIKVQSKDDEEDIPVLSSGEFQHAFKIEPGVRYELYGAKEGFFLSTIQKSTSQKSGELHWEIPMRRIELNREIVLNNIYYDLNKATLREESFIELNRLARWMDQNPSVDIELNAHTDSRGSDAYNLDLSQQRAESARIFLIDSGIDPSRLQAKGYGENKLLNNCDDGVECSEGRHQVNRRTEFKVTSYQPQMMTLNKSN